MKLVFHNTRGKGLNACSECLLTILELNRLHEVILNLNRANYFIDKPTTLRVNEERELSLYAIRNTREPHHNITMAVIKDLYPDGIVLHRCFLGRSWDFDLDLQHGPSHVCVITIRHLHRAAYKPVDIISHTWPPESWRRKDLVRIDDDGGHSTIDLSERGEVRLRCDCSILDDQRPPIDTAPILVELLQGLTGWTLAFFGHNLDLRIRKHIWHSHKSVQFYLFSKAADNAPEGTTNQPERDVQLVVRLDDQWLTSPSKVIVPL